MDVCGEAGRQTTDGLYRFASFLIGYLDNGVSQHRTTITKRQPNDAATRRCGYANCGFLNWERQLLSRHLLEEFYARAELSNLSKRLTIRTASSFVLILLISSHNLLKAYQIYFEECNLYVARRRNHDIKVCTFLSIYYNCFTSARNYN